MYEKYKPYIIKSKHFVDIYNGGAGHKGITINKKRGKIRKLSRASHKRLCLTLDSILYFTPTYRFMIEFNGHEEIKEKFKIIKSFIVHWSNPKNYVTSKIPLFVWKKVFTENGTLIFDILTNLKIQWLENNINKIFLNDWLVHSKYYESKFTFMKVNNPDQTIIDYCFFYKTILPVNENTGRMWGMINLKLYKKKKTKKNYVQHSISGLNDINPEKNDSFKKNFYIKNLKQY